MKPKRIWTLEDLATPAADVSQLRMQARIDSADEDALLSRYLHSATLYVERMTQRALMRRQAVLRTSYLPAGRDGLPLPGGVVSAVSAMTIEGAAFTAFELLGHSPALLVPNDNWPVLTQSGYPVSVTYTCGPATVPADLQVAVLMIAAESYSRRTEGSETAVLTVPINAHELMKSHRIIPL